MGSSVGGYATVGAMFIKEFAEDTPWVHLDIGGTPGAGPARGSTPRAASASASASSMKMLRGMEGE